MAKATLINTDLCLGCNACTVECKRNNDLPVGQGISWARIDELETGTFPNTKCYFIKQSCHHCTDAACVEVCPVGAVSKPDGVHVVINQEECIGCGYCAMSCPFGIPHFGEPKGASQKCSYCYGTKIEGEFTACEIACPFGAIISGERDELVAEGRKQVAALQAKGLSNANLYGENDLGGLHVLYVLADSPTAYGLPENPKISPVVNAWQKVIQPAGLVLGGAAIVGLGVNYIVARANAKRRNR